MIRKEPASAESRISRETLMSYRFRRDMLVTLRDAIRSYESRITEALTQDLGKNPFESYATEIGLLYGEIRFALKHLKAWMRPRRAPTPLVLWPSASRVHPVPLGKVLIIAPWNYPLQLQLAPLVAAVAAGNRAVLKPSEITPHTAQVIADLVEEFFPRDYISVVQGEGSVVVPELIRSGEFDHIFFTGSVEAGRSVGTLAAEYHIPVTLELGGKSPAVVHADADIPSAVKSILYGKIINAGQSCIAPDYLLVHSSVKERIIEEARQVLAKFFPSGARDSADYGFIVNERRYGLLKSLLKEGNILVGGGCDDRTRRIEPTIMDAIQEGSPLLREEIFGPILPLLTYESREELSTLIDERPNPLALYIFGNRSLADYINTHHAFGGGCINDTMVHFVNPALPFGGVGSSGRGSYHGRAGFETMTHYRSMVRSPRRFSLPLKFPPYSRGAYRLLRRFLK